MDDAPRILAGRYQVGELIGRGGMAEVHIGHDTRLGRTVAIKVLRSDLARDPSFQARFRREAQAAAALNHPAIVAVYDTGEEVYADQNGVSHHVPFIVMEYVEGHTVRDILRDGQAVPIEEAVEIAVGVLSALEYSHHAGIVHRDIKPANVMLTPTGAVKVMDFGIARAMADSAATMTQTQAVIGTAQYLSPEQARGESVDARSDLYSTGVLLFEMLTGRPPFTGDSPVAVAYQHVREIPPTPSSLASDVPDVLDRITLKALTKDRESRYSNAAEFRSDLETAVRGGAVNAPPAAAFAAGVTQSSPSLPEPGPEATQVFGAPLPPVTAPTQTMAPPVAQQWAPTRAAAPSPFPVPADEPDEPNRRWLLWTLIAIAALAVLGIAWVLVNNGKGADTPETFKLPGLEKMSEAEAQKTVEDLDLRWKRAEDASDDVDKGFVISSSPAAGTLVAAGDEITVTISSGPGTVKVPDVAGMTQDRARKELAANGLTVTETQTEHVGKVDNNEVTKTDPPADSPVPAGSGVVLYLADGNVEISDYRGKEEAAAVKALEALGVTVKITEVETTEQPAGTVVEQDRMGLVPWETTTVVLTVAKLPENTVIPDNLVGMTGSDAKKALKAAGLKWTTRAEASDATPGTVIYTEPGGGTTVKRDSTVTIVVAKAADVPTPPETP